MRGKRLRGGTELFREILQQETTRRIISQSTSKNTNSPLEPRFDIYQPPCTLQKGPGFCSYFDSTDSSTLDTGEVCCRIFEDWRGRGVWGWGGMGGWGKGGAGGKGGG